MLSDYKNKHFTVQDSSGTVVSYFTNITEAAEEARKVKFRKIYWRKNNNIVLVAESGEGGYLYWDRPEYSWIQVNVNRKLLTEDYLRLQNC